MMTQVLHCPYCDGMDIVQHGTTPEGKQRYRCRACLQGRGRTSLLEYAYAGQSLDIKRQIVDMAMNASGMRDTARVPHVSPTTVMKARKKRRLTSSTSIRRSCSTSTQSAWRLRSVAPTSWPSVAAYRQSWMRCGVMHDLVVGLCINRYEFGRRIAWESTALKHLPNDHNGSNQAKHASGNLTPRD